MSDDLSERRDQTSGFPLEVRLLGAFEVLIGGVPVDVGGSKRGEVVALLALRAGRVLSVEMLAEALWGARRPVSARNALQHHVTRLRKVLGPTAIVSATDGYALGDAVVDALLFADRLDSARAALQRAMARTAAQAADDALNLWRGPALLGFLDADWACTEAGRLEALRVDAMEWRFDAALALGEHSEVLRRIRAAVVENPFRERLWGQLMLALYRSGQQADALDAFQAARRMLSEKLGLEPGPELQRLQAAILAHDAAIGEVPAARRRRGNLPAPVTSFVGRRPTLDEVRQLMRERRLVTLVGPPGAGKSRLALEVARSSEREVPDGAWLVELTRAQRAADVGRVVANAIDAYEPRSERDAVARVVERLRDSAALLVVDNCEHVVGEAARVVATVLARCPGVRVLATSREALGLAGESRAGVAPLPVPDEAGADARDLLSSTAVQLFAARARDARPGFALTAETARIAAQICRRLDGLPLAIELAAARVGVLGLSELLHRLDDQFEVLAHGDRPAPDDDLYSVGIVIDWSFELLGADEKTLLCQVAVFRGGCPLPAAVALGAREGLDETAVTQLLVTLVDRSIVRASFPDGEARYDLLETLREYALAQLAQSGGLAGARAAHAEFFAATAARAAYELREREHRAWLRRLKLEHDNLWAALTYARDACEEGLAVELAAGLGWYFALANLHSEGRAFLELALSIATDAAPVRGRIAAYAELCHLADLELDHVAAIEAGHRGLALAQGVTAPREVALVKSALALALLNTGERRRAVRLLAEARAAYEAIGDEWGLVGCELVAATDALSLQDVDAVAASTERILGRAGAIEYRPFYIWALLLDGWCAERRGDGEAAMRDYGRALDVAHDLDLPHYVAFALAQLGSRASADGDPARAELLQRRAIAIADHARLPWFASHARVQLAATLVRKGEPDAAEALYRMVVDRSLEPAEHHARETFFVALAGSPLAAALNGVAAPATRRGQAYGSSADSPAEPEPNVRDRVSL